MGNYDEIYRDEMRREVLCIDVKSFYASVEAVEMNLDPLKARIIVMSNAENTGGLILAASPEAKRVYGISNVSRKYDLPDPIPPEPELFVRPPRMQFYIQENMRINQFYKDYVAPEDHFIYSIDESFLDVTQSLKLFQKSAYALAVDIQARIKAETGLYVTIGIGDNPLLAKLALDVGAKHQPNGIAEWRYEDVPETVWQIEPLTEMWGIGQRMAARLEKIGIHSVYDLAFSDQGRLEKELGVIGIQLQAHAWGIDRSKLSEHRHPVEKSYGNSQILPRDYFVQIEIETVIREMAEQVAARLRKHHCQTECAQLMLRFSKNEAGERKGFSQQIKISMTQSSEKLIKTCLKIFRENWRGEAVRQIGITYSKLIYHTDVQLDLFQQPQRQMENQKLDKLVDKIRKKYGYTALVHANSLTKGGTAIQRSTLVGGHAGGMEGMEG